MVEVVAAGIVTVVEGVIVRLGPVALPVQNTLVPGGNRALRGEAGQP